MVEIIAEVGQTNEGSIDKAIEAVHAFAEAGATGIKFQWLRPDRIVIPANGTAYWSTNDAVSQHAAFETARMIPYGEWASVIAACINGGVEFITTPFDLEAVREWSRYREDWPALRTLKVASGDITNMMLLDTVGEAADRVILSTGGATFDEIGAAVDVLIGTHNPTFDITQFGDPEQRLVNGQGFPYPRCEVVLLACSLEYPTPMKRANLGRIRTLLNAPPMCGPSGTKFPVGYSDHTMQSDTGGFAVCVGATMLEKHVTLGGDADVVADHAMGLNPERFAWYVRLAREAEQRMGDGVMGVHDGEAAAVGGARRGLYASDNIPAGWMLSTENVIALRPAPTEPAHAPAERWLTIEGTTADRAYKPGDPILI